MTCFKTAHRHAPHGVALRVAESKFLRFGQRTVFTGPVAGLELYDDLNRVPVAADSPVDAAV